jgi:FtsZ-interacting cell division protein ZipA
LRSDGLRCDPLLPTNQYTPEGTYDTIAGCVDAVTDCVGDFEAGEAQDLAADEADEAEEESPAEDEQDEQPNEGAGKGTLQAEEKSTSEEERSPATPKLKQKLNNPKLRQEQRAEGEDYLLALLADQQSAQSELNTRTGWNCG